MRIKEIVTGIMVLAILSGLTEPKADEIIKKMDANMASKNRIFESTMTIHSKRSSRSISSRTYSEGDTKSFTEYLAPAREQGTKMLKLEDKLWIYSPSTDRIIQISGHMLRQSVMGSDLSYEDMMDNRKMTDIYNAIVVGSDTAGGEQVWLLELTAKVENIAYTTRKMWIDKQKFVPLKEELYAKSGKLLKRTILSDVKNIQGRWFPTVIIYKDMLKDGLGTEFHMTSIKFDQQIPEYVFTKAALKK